MCGIAGCYNTPYAPGIMRDGLFMLQHRGQEWVGAVSSDGNNFYPDPAPFRAQGLVMQALTNGTMHGMMGFMAMGHVRYSTQGSSELNNAQPHMAVTPEGPMLFCSNGDIVNCAQLRRQLTAQGYTFYSQNDGEVITKLIAWLWNTLGNPVAAIRAAKKQLIGSFSGIMMLKDRAFLVRDHLEMRPYCLTQSPDGAVFFASESVALDIMTADYPGLDQDGYALQEVSGSEIVELWGGTLIRHLDPALSPKRAHCVFESIYFSRPDSRVFGISVKRFRRRLGAALAREAYPVGDVVAAVPDSAVEAALGVSHESGIELDTVLFRHHYTGRTFIEPDQPKRDYAAKLKFNPDDESIRGKRIILVDDSIVRGTTMRKLVGMLKRHGCSQITLLITCPLIQHSCYYGVDIKGHLVAVEAEGSVERIKQAVGLETHDVLHFLSLPGLESCIPDPDNWCRACLSGVYPTDITCYEAPSAK